MTNDVFTLDENNNAAIRTLGVNPGSAETNSPSVFTTDENGNTAVRVVLEGSGGGGSDPHNLGWYATPEALEEAHATAEAGDWAIVGSTDTVWIWDTDTSAWKDSDQKGQVTSVNNKTGTVVLNALDVGAVPQYNTMPTASASTVGKIVQYVGTTTGSYTHGYIYEGVGGGQPASATITQTQGTSLSNLAIDLETFEEYEEPIGDETITFRYSEISEYPERTIQQGWTGGFVIDQIGMEDGILGTLGWYDDWEMGAELTISVECTGTDQYTITLSMSDKTPHTESALGAIDLENDYSIIIEGVPSAGQTCIKATRYLYEEGWFRVGSLEDTEDIADYGITYTGTPEDGNEIQVVYMVGSGSAYAWQQINVQPESVPVTPSTMPTLAVADWSSNTQTVTVSGVTSSNVVFVAPAPASAADYAAAGIVCTAQGTDSLTFTCDTVPSNDIVVNVVIFG